MSLDDKTPDEMTTCRFRKRPVDHGPGEALSVEISAQFEHQDLIMKTGTLIDATLMEASVRAPDRRSVGGRPAGAANSVNPLDKNVDWGRGDAVRRLHFGYKAHIGIDLGSGLIRRRRMTSAKAHDSSAADELICDDEKAVWADKAYEQKARRQALKRRGAKDRIVHRRNKHHDLTIWQKLRNKLIRPKRALVENMFAT